MKIRMLGTGYGECRIKKFASKDFRRRGGVLVDSGLLLDAPSDIFELADELGFSDLFDRLTAVLVSHSHAGHFDISTIQKLAENKTLSVFADKEVLALIPENQNIIKEEAVPFRPIEHNGYRILPLPSNHRTENKKERCLNYIVSKDKTLLYLLDGGFINNEAFRIISEVKFDAVIMDTATELAAPSEKLMSHGGYETNRIIKAVFISTGSASEKTRFILSHIPSPRKRSVHEELSQRACEDGFTVAYDGYFMNI